MTTRHTIIGALSLFLASVGMSAADPLPSWNSREGKSRIINFVDCKPNTSKPAPGHKIYPYLLRNLPVTRPNQVWAMDITYIPMARGFIYLAAVLDWFTRRVLSWRVSITLEPDFCIEAVEDVLARHGKPEIFNTDSKNVHVYRLHQGAGQPRHQNQHGWQGRMAR
jgi:transposase InsO family protein